MEGTPKLRGGTIFMALAGLAFLILYLIFLVQDFATLQGPGDSAVGNAYATLTALAALWGLLLVLLVADQIRTKRWWTRIAILLVPSQGSRPCSRLSGQQAMRLGHRRAAADRRGLSADGLGAAAGSGGGRQGPGGHAAADGRAFGLSDRDIRFLRLASV